MGWGAAVGEGGGGHVPWHELPLSCRHGEVGVYLWKGEGGGVAALTIVHHYSHRHVGSTAPSRATCVDLPFPWSGDAFDTRLSSPASK